MQHLQADLLGGIFAHGLCLSGRSRALHSISKVRACDTPLLDTSQTVGIDVSGAMGFPATVEAYVTYALYNDAVLKININATADE